MLKCHIDFFPKEPEEPSLWFDLWFEMCPHLVKKAKIEPSPNGLYFCEMRFTVGYSAIFIGLKSFFYDIIF